MMIIITCALLACLLLLINIILLTSFGNTKVMIDIPI